MTRSGVLTVFSVAVLLSGCGDSAPAGPPPKPIERGIFISAADCAASGKLSLEQCGQAIDIAVAQHQVQAPLYPSLARCVAAEGQDRCDKTIDGYRARLQAFLVTMSTPPTAVALYPSAPGSAGFRTATKQAVSAQDDTLTVSVASVTVANENRKLSKR